MGGILPLRDGSSLLEGAKLVKCESVARNKAKKLGSSFELCNSGWHEGQLEYLKTISYHSFGC
jgi:hypothetical protein